MTHTEAQQADDAAVSPPHPRRGWSTRVEVLREALVVPPETRDFTQPAGILRRDRSYCAQGALWRKARPLTTPPETPTGPVRDLPGVWLWGGVLWGHFGHFLVESTGRLWPLPALPEPIAGVLFIPKAPRRGADLSGFQSAFLDLAGVPHTKVLTAPARVEKLFVPGQGFGLGRIAAGTAHARHWYRTHFARNVAPDGPEKLYISRSGLGAGRAKLLCEDHVDRLLEAEGYTVFHPQHHDLATQIARYKAARQVIACEGSAIHLFAMVARPEQRLAILVRRMSEATAFIARHVAGFSGTPPVVVDAISGGWLPEGEVRRRRQISALDFPKAYEALAEAGFVFGPRWENPSRQKIEAALAASSTDRLVPIAD